MGISLLNWDTKGTKSVYTPSKTHPDYDIIWTGYKKSIRKAVRKAANSGVSVYDTDSESDLEAFYEIYLATQIRWAVSPNLCLY